VDEKLVIKQCLNGRNEYFEPLVSKYEQPLYRYCLHLCNDRNDAMDLFQETWLKAVSKIHRYDDNHLFKTWLFSIATNEYRDRYRRAMRRRPYNLFFSNADDKSLVMNRMESTEKQPDATLEEKEFQSLVKAEVGRLKWDYRTVVVLHYFEEMGLREISTVLNIPVGTVKSRLYYARGLLKTRMEMIL